MRTAIAVRQDEVFLALRELGVEQQELHDSARYGEWAKSSCHPYDPPMYPGIAGWAHTMRRLRVLVVPRGWKPVNDHGMAFVLSPNGKVAISTWGGDENTANPHVSPKTRFPKGPVARSLVRHNCEQLSIDGLGFDDEVETETPLTHIPEDAITYYLLVARKGPNLVSELSVPIGFDVTRRATGWTQRIILQTTAVGEPTTPPQVDSDPINIEVTPRGG